MAGALLSFVAFAITFATSASAITTFSPPQEFKEGTALITALGGSSCAPENQNGSPEYFVAHCEVTEGMQYEGMTVNFGRCFATVYTGSEKYDCDFDFDDPNHDPHAAGARFLCQNYSEYGPRWKYPFSESELVNGVPPTAATLADCVAVAKRYIERRGVAPGGDPTAKPKPVAEPDACWIKEFGEAKVAAPGILENDKDPSFQTLTAKVVKINFGRADHPYTVGSDGSLSFKANATPNHRPFVAEITYQAVNASGGASSPATVKIYIQPEKPESVELNGCGGNPKEADEPDSQERSKCSAADFDISWTGVETANLKATCVKRGYVYAWREGTCPSKLQRATYPPPVASITLPKISHKKVWLCAQKGKGKIYERVEDAMTPVYKYAPDVYLAEGEQYFPAIASHFIEDSALILDKPDAGTTTASSPSCKDEVLVSKGSVRAAWLAGNGAPPYVGEEYVPELIHAVAYNTLKCKQSGSTIRTNGEPAVVSKSRKGNGQARTGIKLDLKSTADYAGNLNHAPVYVVYKPGAYIAYWFFYAYNGWHWGALSELHEGDWEHVRVLLNGKDEATGIEYFQHYCSGEMIDWDGKAMSVVRAGGREQPLVFSALGGHASYPTIQDREIACRVGLTPQGFDIANFGREWDTSKRIADATKEPWWGYGGNWGDYISSTFGNYGPPAPGPYRRF